MNRFGKTDAEVIPEYHPLFRGLLWVASARSSDETREVINMINVERDGLVWKIVATDGRRMHVHTFDPGLFDDDIDLIEEGLYEVIAKTNKLIVIAPSECGSPYPNWRGILPDQEPSHEDQINPRTISRLGITTGVLLAADFTADAIGFACRKKKEDAVHVEYGPSLDKTGAFLIRHNLGDAIVMPIRMDDEDQDVPKPENDVEATPYMTGFEAVSKLDEAALQEPLEELQALVKKGGGKLTATAG